MKMIQTNYPSRILFLLFLFCGVWNLVNHTGSLGIKGVFIDEGKHDGGVY